MQTHVVVPQLEPPSSNKEALPIRRSHYSKLPPMLPGASVLPTHPSRPRYLPVASLPAGMQVLTKTWSDKALFGKFQSGDSTVFSANPMNFIPRSADVDSDYSHVSTDNNERNTDTASIEWDEGIVDGTSDESSSSLVEKNDTAVLLAESMQKRILLRLRNIRKTRNTADGIGHKEFSYTLLGLVIFGITAYQTLRMGLSLWLLLPLSAILSIPLFIAYFIFFSHFITPQWMATSASLDNASCDYVSFEKKHFQNLYSERRVPLLTFLDAYIANEANTSNNQSIHDVFVSRSNWATFGLSLDYVAILLEHWMSVLPFGGKVLSNDRFQPFELHNEELCRAFMGSSMRQACGIVDPQKSNTLTEIQQRALDAICKAACLSSGKSHLDIGCGYGQLVCHAVEQYGTASTGIAADPDRILRGMEKANQMNLPKNQTHFLCLDYRDIPDNQYDAITCIGQHELLSVHQLPQLLNHIYRFLKDDGIILLQVDTTRAAWQLEDINWNLFVDKYITPGIETRLPLCRYLKMLEQAGFEIASIENLSSHAATTYELWYDNWEDNEQSMVATYGKRHWRVWAAYLAWTSIALRQGTAGCYQIVAHKNINAFDRTTVISK
ncbi:S-adenosyl-L-methionine-dependent methyltransferase [Syncephalis fuscata]|nr:S-adenosyl-L-methionine-dependent methyltransferase [Syncephalis fuscata]